MLLYVLVLGIAAILASWAQRNYRHDNGEGAGLPRIFSLRIVPVFVVLSGVAALRWRVGGDYDAYYRAFPTYVEEATQGVSLFNEPGIRILAWLANRVSGEATLMFALASIITVGLIIITVWKWSPSFVLGVVFFILAGAWHGSFNGVRQYLAAAVLLAGHRFIISRRFLMFGGVVTCAALFHISAIVGLVLYFVPRRRMRVRGIAMTFIASTSILIGSSFLLSALYSFSYGDEPLGAYALLSVNPLRVAFAFVPMFVLFALPVSSLLREPGNWFYGNMLIVHAAIQLAASNSALLSRFSIYSSVFLALSIPYLLAQDNRVDRYVARSGLVALFFVFWFVEVAQTENLINFMWVFNRAGT